MRSHARPLLGVTYLAVITVLVTTSILAYTKSLPWQNAITVTLTSTTPGLELNPLSDVKIQGVRVGEVRRITSTGRNATIELALDPDKVSLIPANVDAAIIPKTLFGEKFVDLRVPAHPSSARLVAGSVIRQSTTSVEIGQLFSDLVPVLDALKPEQLSVVLTSLAEALDGRGADLARTLNQLKGTLDVIDPHLATLTHDLDQFARTANVYADAAPDLVRILAASTKISSELLIPKEQHLSAFLDQVIGTAEQTEQVLRENAQHLITLSGRARPVLEVLDQYSPVLGCLLGDLHTADILANQSVGARGPFVNLAVDLITQHKPYTYPDDLPSNPHSDANNGNVPAAVPSWQPHCARFAPWVYKLKNAEPYSMPLPGLTNVPGRPASPAGVAPAPGSNAAMNSAVEEARAALARAVAAQLMGVAQEKVPPYAELLLAPLMADGGQVRLP